jgi:hypothetical protein
MPKTRRAPIIGTGVWIRNHLLTVGADYTYNMWKRFSEFLESQGVGPPPKYQSFAHYVWVLKEIGLIKPVERERGISGFPRTYYTIAPGREVDLEAWKNPQAKKYGKKVKLGRRRYRRRILKIPPKTKAKSL